MAHNGTQPEQQKRNYTVITEPPFPPGWVMAPHSHRQHEVVLVKSGSSDIILDDESRLLVENDVFVIPGGVRHGFRAHEEIEFTVVQFTDLPADLLSELINQDPIGMFPLTDLEKGLFSNLCYQLQKEIAGDLPYSSLQCETLIYQIAITLLRSDLVRNPPEISSEQKQLIESAIEWMHQNASRHILVRDVAAQVGLSESHFRTLFRRMTHTSPKQYLMALQLQASKCLLMHADSTVTDVAMRAGFSSPQQFSKVFRQLTGVTPTEWRRAYLYADLVEGNGAVGG